MKNLWWRLTDPFRNLWTRYTYCRTHGHKWPLFEHGCDNSCLNCGQEPYGET